MSGEDTAKKCLTVLVDLVQEIMVEASVFTIKDEEKCVNVLENGMILHDYLKLMRYNLLRQVAYGVSDHCKS